LVRHGQTILNKQHRYQGLTDSSLTEYGKWQARAVAYRLRRIPFDVVLISPMERTRATAAVIVAAHPAPPPLQEIPGWHEIHHGRWEGLTHQEVDARFPEEAEARFAHITGRPYGGESLADVFYRVRATWDDMLYRYPGGRVLVVTSATPIQCVLCAVLGVSPDKHWHWRIDLGSITYLDVYETGAIIRMVNELPRLHAVID